MGSRLSAMFERSGLITAGQATAAREYAISQELGVAEAMLHLGLVDHDSIVAFCASKLLIPRVSEEALAHVTPDAHGRIPAGLAWKYRVLPVSVDDRRNLTLAMLDPTDDEAVRAVTHETGCIIIRAAANGGQLRSALGRIYGDPDEARRSLDPNATQPGLPRPPPTPPPQDTAAIVEPREPGTPSETSASRSWNPPLASREAEPVPLSPDAFAAILPRLRAAESRDEITNTVLGFLAAGFARTLLFVHTNDELRGHDGRGRDLLLDAVRQVRIPTVGPSAFATAIRKRAAFFGPMPALEPIDRAFTEAMGGIHGNVLLLPMPIGQRVPLLVFAMGATGPVDPRSVTALSFEAADALKRILLARRRR